ncbi:MAG: M12 family metallopeptidase [Caldilineaceae bacterium]
MNKLGFYLQNSKVELPGVGDVLQDVFRKVRPPVILVHADSVNSDLLRLNRKAGGTNAFVIGRMFKEVGQQEKMLKSSDPAAEGRKFADEILSKDPFLYFEKATMPDGSQRLLIDAWMSLNEPSPGPAWNHFQEQKEELRQRYQAYDAFQVGFRQRLQEKGIEAIAFNFGAGNFTQPEHYLENFPRTLAAYKYLGFHEYAWPHMDPTQPDPQRPGERTVSSVGIYRRCMQGIAQQLGGQHKAIITEAGLTREHNGSRDHVHLDPRDLGEETRGWLCFTEPLSQPYYFSSLQWYNNFLAQDDFVLGACLYQVGHTRSFIGHRHLGEDGAGNKLQILDWIADLAHAPASGVVTESSAVIQSATIRGRVTADGVAVTGATVRLIGQIEALGSRRQAVLSLPTPSIVWDRTLQGLEGDRWRCYQKYVAQEVAGLSYVTFKEQVLLHNPALAQSNHEFLSAQSYLLPRNTVQNADIQWNRSISGFAGSRWHCWQKFVAGRVLGLSWSDFEQHVTSHNPDLIADQGAFLAHKRYQLPQNPAYPQAEMVELADEDGRFAFEDLPAGSYRLLVNAPGYETLEHTIDALREPEIDLPLVLRIRSDFPAAQSTTPPPVSVREGRFFQGSQPFARFAGVNLPLLLHLGDPNITRTDDLSLGEYLDKTKALGATVVRLFVPHHTLSNQEMAQRLKRVLPEFAARNLYLIPVLIDLYSNSGAYPKVMEEYLVNFRDHDPSRRLGPGFFREGYKTDAYRAYLKSIIEAVPPAFGHTILAWEIGNELKMEHPGDNPPETKNGDPTQFVNFNREMANMIKEIDHSRHLVTTGMISTQHVYLKGQAELIRKLYDHSAIDFITVHVYYGENAGPIGQALPNNEPDSDAVLAHILGKPILVEEAGIDKSNDEFTKRWNTDLDRWFKQPNWQGQARQPAVGYMIWRPPFGKMGSGSFHIPETLLGVAPSAAPAIALAQPLQQNAATSRINKIGIDLNQPIFGRQPSEIANNPQLLAQTGAGWVRLNFVLEQAGSPADPEWQATYGRITDNYLAAGFQIYGLIGGQAVKTPLEQRLLHSVQLKSANGSRGEAEAWLDEYEANFLQIVQHFGDRVKHFESFNEPNNWAIPGVMAPVVDPTWYAHILQRIYKRVKSAFSDVKLISGPLLGHFHHQPSGRAAPDYLRQAYEEGRRLGWHNSGKFPFDGIGYHLYLKPNQQTDFSNGAEVPGSMTWEMHAEKVRGYYNTFTKAMLQVVKENEGANQQKRLFISEMGWDSADNSEHWLAFQARSVELGLGLMSDDPQVALGFWFCTRDFPGENKGLFKGSSPLAQANKPALAAFQSFCSKRFGPAQPVQQPVLPQMVESRATFCAVPNTPVPVVRQGLNPGQVQAVLMLRKKWVNGTQLKYYFFDQPNDGSSVLQPNNTQQWTSWVGSEEQKAIVRQAFQLWKEVGIGLEFKEVTERSEAEIRIGFQRGDGHWSYVGRDIIDLVPSPNERTMNFDWRPGSTEQLDTAMHEIGHSLGLEHEHQNPVAGIVWDEEAVYRYFSAPPNRWDRAKTEFNIIRKINPDEVQGSSWDPNSIMEYSFEPGLIKEPAAYTKGLNRQPGLSERDRTWALTFYPGIRQAPETLLPFVSSPLALRTGEQKDFMLAPTATRAYSFSTFGDADVVMVLFEEIDGEPRYVTAEDDSAVEHNAQFQARLFAGRHYILRIRLYYGTGSPEAAVMVW